MAVKKKLRLKIRPGVYRRFGRLAKHYWVSEERWSAIPLLLLALALLVGQTQLSVKFIAESGEITSALAAKDGARFRDQLYIYGAWLLAGVPIYSLYYFVRETLALRWRRWMTKRVLGKYFSDRAFYRLTWQQDVIDNPDQRIAEDIRTFTQQSLTFLLIFVGAILQLAAFSHVLWGISHTLVYFLLVYATFGTLVTALGFSKNMVNLNFAQLRREADFRFSLVRVRENAESISFYRGEKQESAQVRARFHEAYLNFKRLLRWTLGLNVFQWSFSFTSFIVPSLIIGPHVLSGELEVGKIVQAGGAFAGLLTALTVFIENFEQLSKFAAGVDRLDAFNRAVEIEAKRTENEDPEKTITRIEDGTRFALDNVLLQTPNKKRTLVKELTMDIDGSLVIVGPSGGGKSSLLRAIAGLWTAGDGTIHHPPLEDMLFLPQRAYMILGDLRSQLLYPGKDDKATDEELQSALESVNLGTLAERIGGFATEVDFAKVLSLGEQQRLAVARVILNKPRFTILDEATSALDRKNEDQMYRLLKATDTTLISVSHHESILQFHDKVLELDGAGGWKVSDAKDYQFAE